MLTNNELKNYINSGASLDKQLKNITCKDGFMVSLLGYEKIFNINDIEEIKNTIKEYQKIIHNNEYIGLWKNDDKIYIDISKKYQYKTDAIKTGIKNKQLAIYDLKNNCDIKLTQTIYILYRYNKTLKDYRLVNEYYNINDLKERFKMNYDVLKNYMYKTINEGIRTFLNGEYIILKDKMYIRDVMEILEG